MEGETELSSHDIKIGMELVRKPILFLAMRAMRTERDHERKLLPVRARVTMTEDGLSLG